MNWRKNDANTKISPDSINRFKVILSKITNILERTQNFEQASYLIQLVDLLDESSIDEFVNKLNTSECWGGSGAVWEVQHNFNNKTNKEFKQLLLEILKLMKEENIMGKRAKSVFKYLEKEYT